MMRNDFSRYTETKTDHAKLPGTSPSHRPPREIYIDSLGLRLSFVVNAQPDALALITTQNQMLALIH